MPVHLGGPTARKVIHRKDMTCAFHYINEEETACFFAQTRKTLDGRPFGAYCVPLSSAWQYAEDDYLITAARKAAEIMGFDPHSRFDVKKIADFFQDMLIELVTMQPIPDAMRERPPEFEVSHDGGRLILTTDVQVH